MPTLSGWSGHRDRRQQKRLATVPITDPQPELDDMRTSGRSGALGDDADCSSSSQSNSGVNRLLRGRVDLGVGWHLLKPDDVRVSISIHFRVYLAGNIRRNLRQRAPFAPEAVELPPKVVGSRVETKHHLRVSPEHLEGRRSGSMSKRLRSVVPFAQHPEDRCCKLVVHEVIELAVCSGVSHGRSIRSIAAATFRPRRT